MASVAKQIIGSFEDIGKDIVRETVNVPKDLAGKALESLGTSSQKGQQGNPAPQVRPEVQKPPEKPVAPRRWLEDFARSAQKTKTPTVQEQHEQEDREKNERENKKGAVAQKMAPLAPVSTKQKRGMLYGVKQKSGSETSKNVRQD